MCRSITNDEIKNALNSIDDNKAHGPNGYSFKFFKIAWYIIVEDVCEAVQEFFTTGKLLGELNATIISRVPKIRNPSKVSDFRPIELLKGYGCKQGKQRRAFKIDIMKACDIVIWVFLEEVFNGFGFPMQFVGWIMTCIKTASFSNNVNCESFSCFKGGKGQRQEDPISPYLFTIVMGILNLILQWKINQTRRFQCHQGCVELKITSLCFANDLLVLCNGDANLVQVIKQDLEEFTEISSVHPNKGKSTMFCSNIST
ncbi:RNA-directed DNA polymerase, eukaryota, reverse transcriptase zinc-binding domain protein [Tanacetum coccineum]|uniref:RNA-directed DNA polymerase, eukaryota, reverse transcriptase zinc-binding domain protein n=1 Tax=Tanacetum coccineum TaxID=301880 RepID=A0ABQ5EYM6_9ASTR